MTKQRKYQLAHKANGLCHICPKPAVDGTFCLRHLLENRTRMRNQKRQQLGLHPWRPGGMGRPPKGDQI
jgi:hypothetical protein